MLDGTRGVLRCPTASLAEAACGLTAERRPRISVRGTPLPTEGRPSGRMDFMTGKPLARPRAPFFSSGPCAKRPGWSPQNLKTDTLGRSHRAKLGKARLKR